MEGKIMGFQFEPVCSKRTCPGHSDGRDRDKVETEHVRLSTQKW